jgi:hypothetical protein
MDAPRAPHLDIPIGDVTYRIKRFSPKVGSFILLQVSTKLLPAFAGGGIRFKGMPFTLGGSPMTEEEFYTVQNHCLAICGILNEAKTAAPAIMMSDGRLDPRVADDFPLVMALTIHALKFNIEPFFSEDNPALASLGSLFSAAPNSKDSQPSTDSFGAQ